MQNMQKNDETGMSESESCSESSQGQTGGNNPDEQSLPSGSSMNMGNETFVNNGQNSYQGIPQNSINQTQQSPEQSFTGQSGSQAAAESTGGQDVVQNAHDVPHYTSDGYILGRPQEANNPQTAGNIQGSSQIPLPGGFQGTVSGGYQQVSPQMQPQQPQMQPQQPQQPQSIYNQVPPNPQPQNIYQQNPAQPVFQQNPYNSQYVSPYPYGQVPPPQPPPLPSGEQVGEGEKRHGQIVDVVNGLINGDPPDIPKLINVFENVDTQFWKGAVIGAVLVLVATNDTVKKTISNAFSGVVGKASGTENEKGKNNV
ncbi:MAG: hypothetical protein JJW03_03840 [Desulfosarcina sp.]|nr:hypothetical protein [Desulfobacterales bacterium]